MLSDTHSLTLLSVPHTNIHCLTRLSTLDRDSCLLCELRLIPSCVLVESPRVPACCLIDGVVRWSTGGASGASAVPNSNSCRCRSTVRLRAPWCHTDDGMPRSCNAECDAVCTLRTVRYTESARYMTARARYTGSQSCHSQARSFACMLVDTHS
jgi:hypothetical protein